MCSMGALERTQYTVEVGCRWMVYCLSRVLCVCVADVRRDEPCRW